MRTVYTVIRLCLLAMLLVTTTIRTVTAQEASSIETQIMPNHEGLPYVMEKGWLSLPVGEETLRQRYVLRYPEQKAEWNGRLVVGVRGTDVGGSGYRRSWGEPMDYVIGRYAEDQRYAYAGIDVSSIDQIDRGVEITTRFTRFIITRLQEQQQRHIEHTYLAGLLQGGSIARMATEDPDSPYDGVLIISGGGGDMPTWLERHARIGALWPEVDPRKHADLPDDDPNVIAFAEILGVPVEARKFWRFTPHDRALAQLRQALAEYGLNGLTDDQLKQFRVADYTDSISFMEQLTAHTSTGKVTVPTIEVAGTHDDRVIREVMAYKDKVRDISRDAEQPSPADLYRLYRLQGVWHITLDPDFYYGNYGKTYTRHVHEAFASLDRRVTEHAPLPENRTLIPDPPEYRSFDKINNKLSKKPLILQDNRFSPQALRVYESARETAMQLNRFDMDTEHLLFALFEDEDSANRLRTLGMDLDAVRRDILRGESYQYQPMYFKRLFETQLEVKTVQPIDGTEQHAGRLMRITPEEAELAIEDRSRVIPFKQIIGAVKATGRGGDTSDLSLDQITSFWFKLHWRITTDQPIDGAKEHAGRLVQLRETALTIRVGDQSRMIPLDQIAACEYSDPDRSVFTRDISEIYVRQEVKQVLKVALTQAEALQAEQVTPEHILRALIRLHKGSVREYLERYKITYEKAEKQW